MKKRIITILIVVTIIIATFIIIKTSETTKKIPKLEKITPLMYKVTKEDSNNIIYLIGSMHIINLNEIEYPEYLINAYNTSNYLAVEADIVDLLSDSEKLLKFKNSIVYNDNTTVKDHLSEDSYNKLVEFLKKNNMYSKRVEAFKLSYFESLISNLIAKNAGINSTDGLDSEFLKNAKNDYKKVLEVESVDFQLDLQESFPDRLYELSIINMIDNFDEQVEEMKKLYDIWKRGDKEELIELINSGVEEENNYSESDIKLIKEYNYKMIDERNFGMKEKFDEFFNDNKRVLFMVGAAHLVGDNGLIKLLTDSGYTLKQLNK